MNIIQTKEAISTLFKSNITPLLIGQRGVGKSEAVKQYAKENDYGLVELRLGQADGAGDLIGLADFLKDDSGQNVSTKFIVPHFLPKDGKWIIFLDEINRASKDVLQAVFELVYDKSISINGYKLPEGSHVIAAQNPSTEDYQVLDFNDSAFQDRFCHIKVEPTVKEWISYGKSISVNPLILSFISESPKMLEPNLVDFNLDVQPSRRSYMALSRVEENCENEMLFLEISQGLVGVEAALAYNKFKSEVERTIKPTDILSRYAKVKDTVLKYSHDDTNRSDILRETCDNLAEHLKTMKKLTKTQENNIVKFVKDIPKDLAMAFITQELVKIKVCEDTVCDNDEICDYTRVIKDIKVDTVLETSKAKTTETTTDDIPF